MRPTKAVCLGTRRTLRKLALVALAFLVTLSLPLVSRAATPASITLKPSVTSPQKLGTPVTWTATVQNALAGHTYGYQFSVTYTGQTQIVSDFSPTPTFTWVPHTVEGAYAFNVVVRDITTTPYTLFAPVSVSFDLLPWVTAPLAAGVINPTSHPLVALFSAPPCAAGNQLLVRFQPAAATASQNPNSMTTNLVPCSVNSANFYIAGMYPSTKYLMHWEQYAGTTLVSTGSNLTFTTGALSSAFPARTFTVNVPAEAHDATYPVALFQSGPYPVATDLSANVLWYYASALTSYSLIARVEPGGNFYSYPTDLILEQRDLAGNLVVQTNLEILNEQMIAKGYPKLLSFDQHEARNLPDGNIALLGTRYVVSTSEQGGTPANPVTISGDLVLVVDHNLQLVWAWDPFAHQDITRVATNADKITGTTVNDWTHTNAVQGTVDGNLIISERSQDMVLKINYAKGKGDGSVIWMMGAGLDFKIANPPSGSCDASSIPGDPNILPWFTHQHDAHFDYEDAASGDGYMIMTVFDDGNTRTFADCSGTQNSRGMVFLVDEPNRLIYETVSDLGGYSFALGAAQLLTPPDGNLYASFDSGILPGPTAGSYEGQLIETNSAGKIVYNLQLNQLTYRAYRMPNLYTPTEFEVPAATGIAGALPPGQPFDYSAGFAQDQDAFQTNGNGSLSGNSFELTDGGSHEVSSIFYGSPVDIQTFTTEFTFQLTSPNADGFTFTIQNAGPNALGLDGGALGYQNIGESVAIKFDLYNNSGEGPDSTGIYTDGAIPTVPSVNLTGSGIDLHSGHPFDARMTYDGTTLHLRLVDMVTGASWAHPFTINIPGTVGGNTAYIGFTAGTGNTTAVQQILSWSYEPGVVPFDPPGAPTATGLATNGSASVAGSTITLTNGGMNQAGSVFFMTPVNVQSFNSDFDFQLTNAAADGFTFTIQGVGPKAIGNSGGALGYTSIAESVAVKFDLYSNSGEGPDSTGLYTDGAAPTMPSINLTGTGIDLHSGDMMHAHLSYDGNALTLTLTDS
jgi:hypothetical protein